MGIKNIDGVKCEEIKMLTEHNNDKKTKPLSRKALEASGGGINRIKINGLALYNIEQSIASLKQIRLMHLAMHGLLCKPSGGCLLLPKSLISSKMASPQLSRKRRQLPDLLLRSYRK